MLRRVAQQAVFRGPQLRRIATSGSGKESSAAGIVSPLPDKNAPVTVEDFSNPTQNKNWVSYGFDRTDQTTDNNMHHMVFFIGISLVTVFCGSMWGYKPDNTMRHWASREAFLELRRREAEGLPLIDRNYVDPANIVLPSDEELKGFEIII
ncbi:NADH dehydrogenase [ubiquinone] 1 beta subcomplex subunit NP15.6 [Arctopsyche grandis]|uniref:NADH dehydrogenase [ubiquinone] 1 beta subcomplex subunit NP15.6 n=1 Tax=Arctopsyche grandis TaxID=121162 RepID=UPI00406D91EF